MISPQKIEPKYTEPTRTSSSSFKPPMSKEVLALKQQQQSAVPEQSDMQSVSLFSFIKNVFTSRGSGESTSSVSSNKTEDTKHTVIKIKEKHLETAKKSLSKSISEENDEDRTDQTEKELPSKIEEDDIGTTLAVPSMADDHEIPDTTNVKDILVNKKIPRRKPKIPFSYDPKSLRPKINDHIANNFDNNTQYLPPTILPSLSSDCPTERQSNARFEKIEQFKRRHLKVPPTILEPESFENVLTTQSDKSNILDNKQDFIFPPREIKSRGPTQNRTAIPSKLENVRSHQNDSQKNQKMAKQKSYHRDVFQSPKKATDIPSKKTPLVTTSEYGRPILEKSIGAGITSYRVSSSPQAREVEKSYSELTSAQTNKIDRTDKWNQSDQMTRSRSKSIQDRNVFTPPSGHTTLASKNSKRAKGGTTPKATISQTSLIDDRDIPLHEHQLNQTHASKKKKAKDKKSVIAPRRLTPHTRSQSPSRRSKSNELQSPAIGRRASFSRQEATKSPRRSISPNSAFSSPSRNYDHQNSSGRQSKKHAKGSAYPNNKSLIQDRKSMHNSKQSSKNARRSNVSPPSPPVTHRKLNYPAPLSPATTKRYKAPTPSSPTNRRRSISPAASSRNNARQSISPTASSSMNARRSISPIPSSPANARRSNSPAPLSPMNARSSHSPVPSSSINGRRSTSPVPSSSMNGKRSNSPVPSYSMNGRRSNSPAPLSPNNARRTNSPASSSSINARRRSKSPSGSSPFNVKRSNSPTGSSPFNAKRSNSPTGSSSFNAKRSNSPAGSSTFSANRSNSPVSPSPSTTGISRSSTRQPAVSYQQSKSNTSSQANVRRSTSSAQSSPSANKTQPNNRQHAQHTSSSSPQQFKKSQGNTPWSSKNQNPPTKKPSPSTWTKQMTNSGKVSNLNRHVMQSTMESKNQYTPKRQSRAQEQKVVTSLSPSVERRLLESPTAGLIRKSPSWISSPERSTISSSVPGEGIQSKQSPPISMSSPVRTAAATIKTATPPPNESTIETFASMDISPFTLESLTYRAPEVYSSSPIFTGGLENHHSVNCKGDINEGLICEPPEYLSDFKPQSDYQSGLHYSTLHDYNDTTISITNLSKDNSNMMPNSINFFKQNQSNSASSCILCCNDLVYNKYTIDDVQMESVGEIDCSNSSLYNSPVRRNDYDKSIQQDMLQDCSLSLSTIRSGKIMDDSIHDDITSTTAQMKALQELNLKNKDTSPKSIGDGQKPVTLLKVGSARNSMVSHSPVTMMRAKEDQDRAMKEKSSKARFASAPAVAVSQSPRSSNRAWHQRKEDEKCCIPFKSQGQPSGQPSMPRPIPLGLKNAKEASPQAHYSPRDSKHKVKQQLLQKRVKMRSPATPGSPLKFREPNQKEPMKQTQLTWGQNAAAAAVGSAGTRIASYDHTKETSTPQSEPSVNIVKKEDSSLDILKSTMSFFSSMFTSKESTPKTEELAPREIQNVVETKPIEIKLPARSEYVNNGSTHSTFQESLRKNRESSPWVEQNTSENKDLHSSNGKLVFQNHQESTSIKESSNSGDDSPPLSYRMGGVADTVRGELP